MIYFALDDDGTALATCMAKPIEGNTWQLCKLGSNKNRKHSGSGSNSWAYTRLGHIDMTQEELTDMLGSKNVTVTLEKQGCKRLFTSLFEDM